MYISLIRAFTDTRKLRHKREEMMKAGEVPLPYRRFITLERSAAQGQSFPFARMSVHPL